MQLSTFDIIAQPRLLADGAPFSFRYYPDLRKPLIAGAFFCPSSGTRRGE